MVLAYVSLFFVSVLDQYPYVSLNMYIWIRSQQDTCLGDQIKQKQHNLKTQIVSIEVSNLIVLVAAHVSMCPSNHVSPPVRYCDTGDTQESSTNLKRLLRLDNWCL